MNYFYSNFLNGYPDPLRQFLFTIILLILIIYLMGIPITYFIYKYGSQGHRYENQYDRISMVLLLWLKTPATIMNFIIILFRILFK